VLAAVRRIVKAECEASGAQKEATFEPISQYPLTVNDKDTTEKLKKALEHFLVTILTLNSHRIMPARTFPTWPLPWEGRMHSGSGEVLI